MTQDIEELRRRAAKCTTHHHACDCRELAFAEAQAENAELRARVPLRSEHVHEILMLRARLAHATELLERGGKWFAAHRTVCVKRWENEGKPRCGCGYLLWLEDTNAFLDAQKEAAND